MDMLRAVSEDRSSKPEVVVDGAERDSVTYGDGFKGEHRASFSALVSCLFGGTVRVGRLDARRKVCVSLADFFDVERNPATTCLVASPCFGNMVSSGPSVGNSGPSGKRASGIVENSAASGLLGMASGSSSRSAVSPETKPAGIVGNSGSSGKRAPVFVKSTIFDNSASGLTGMPSGSSSGPSVLPVPKSAGIVEGAETSFKDEMMLSQQLTKAFQTGLRHSLDDPDHDAMSDLSKMWVEYTCQSMVAAELDSYAATVHFSLPFSAYLLVQTVAAFFVRGMQSFQQFLVDRYSLVDAFSPGFLHLRDWEGSISRIASGMEGCSRRARETAGRSCLKLET